MQVREQVSLVRCASSTEDAQIVRRTEEAITQLDNYAERLRGAHTIAIKINAGVDRVILTDGKQTELTEPAVVEGVIRAIRAVSDAPIILGDATTDGGSHELYAKLGYPERLAPYANVRLVDFNASELVEIKMPHQDGMFQRYWLPRELVEADAFVSVAKMKAHASMGCTLCIKNLFGWMPTSVYGAPRMYLHDRLIRLPRVLWDMTRFLNPCLNVVDGIVAANKSEWGGEPMRPGVILAGTNIVATDSVAARVMGFDPEGDYPDHPFLYRRNVLKFAHEAGLGPMRPFVLGPHPREVAVPFSVKGYEGATHREAQLWRGALCVARYRERQAKLAARYRGRYLALFDGNVLWDGPDMAAMQRLEHESGRDWKDAPQFVVRCLPPDEEIENFGWYQAEAEFATQEAVLAMAV